MAHDEPGLGGGEVSDWPSDAVVRQWGEVLGIKAVIDPDRKRRAEFVVGCITAHLASASPLAAAWAALTHEQRVEVVDVWEAIVFDERGD